MKKIEEEIRKILKTITKNNDPTTWDQTYIFSPGSLDSLDMATLALTLEEKFAIKISDEDLVKITTISSIEDYVNAAK